MSVETLIAAFGAPGILLGCIAEGETVAFLGGVLAHRGVMPVGLAAGMAMLGAFLADQAVFHAARHARGHRRVLAARNSAAGQRVLAIVARAPLLFAFGFRFVPGMRIVGPVVLAASDVPSLLFMALNAVAAAIWAAIYVALGYHFGLALEALAGRLHIGAVLGLVAVVGIALWWLRRHR